MSNSGQAQSWWFDRISEAIARMYYNPNIKSIAKFGANPAVSAGGGYEDVWEGGGLYPFPTSAGVLAVVSASAEDAVGGTGTPQVRIEGLDANYDELSETVTLTGTTPVNTTGAFLRVNRMFILGTPGTNGTNVGLITATHGVAGVVGRVGANEGQTLQAVYTVPRGYNGFLQAYHVHIEGGANAVIDAEIYRRVNLGTFAGGWRNARIGTATTDVPYEDNIANAGSTVTGGDDIRATVEAVSGTNIAITAHFEIVLFKDGTA